MSKPKSLNTLLVEVLIFLETECVFIRVSSNHTFQNICAACWAFKDVGLKRSIALDNSRHAPLWHFCLQGRIAKTSSPGFIFIVWHQVLCHISEHGTSSMGKHLLAKAHLAKLNNFTKLEYKDLTSSAVKETTLAIQTRQGTQAIATVSSQRKFIFDILVVSILLRVTHKMLQTGSSELSKYWNSPRHLELLPHIRISFGTYSLERNHNPGDNTVI